MTRGRRDEHSCPKCGHDAAHDAACPGCGHTAGNGAAKPRWIKPPPPPELEGVVFEKTPPELLEEMRRTFDEAEYLASVREIERTGGVQIDDLIADLERRLDGNA